MGEGSYFVSSSHVSATASLRKCAMTAISFDDFPSLVLSGMISTYCTKLKQSRQIDMDRIFALQSAILSISLVGKNQINVTKRSSFKFLILVVQFMVLGQFVVRMAKNGLKAHLVI